MLLGVLVSEPSLPKREKAGTWSATFHAADPEQELNGKQGKALAEQRSWIVGGTKLKSVTLSCSSDDCWDQQRGDAPGEQRSCHAMSVEFKFSNGECGGVCGENRFEVSVARGSGLDPTGGDESSNCLGDRGDEEPVEWSGEQQFTPSGFLQGGGSKSLSASS